MIDPLGMVVSASSEAVWSISSSSTKIMSIIFELRPKG